MPRRLISLHGLAAFLYGFIGAVIFLIPVLILLNNLVVVLIFTVFWFWLWTYVGSKFNFYTDAIVAYSIGGGTGVVLTLYYGAAINAAILGFFGV